MNPKKLYEAQGFAVKEMLKIATMMNKAMQSSNQVEDDESGGSMMDFNMSSKIHNLKAARQLASEITDSISRNLDTNTE